ncbi:hypothetical protein DL93DRAFT_2074855 [Clavulina sp. PMI_390]|nr:hypothetical protein DL93DRAFT_2074855 [Clavulina sp. PMI_390]
MFVRKVAATAVHPSARGFASALLSKSEKDWLAKSANDLRKEAKARGLAHSGTKAEIARRLMKAEQASLQAVSEQVSGATPTTPAPSASTSSSATPASRKFTSSAKYNLATETSSSKFTPRRPYIMNIQLPEDAEPVEEGPTIPYAPDYFQSHHSQSASPIQEPPNPSAPRVLTVASAATHAGGGPSHTLWGGAVDPHLVDSHGADAAVELSVARYSASAAALLQAAGLGGHTGTNSEKGLISDILDDVGLTGFKLFPSSAPTASVVETLAQDPNANARETVKGAVKDVKSVVSNIINHPNAEAVAEKYAPKEPSEGEEMSAQDRQGLVALAGIVSAGYFLSKVFV